MGSIPYFYLIIYLIKYDDNYANFNVYNFRLYKLNYKVDDSYSSEQKRHSA